MTKMKSGYFVYIVALLAVGSGCGASKSEKPRPNILWITIEDTSPHFIGCYGDKAARTPFIDGLASEGVRFVNAFSTGTVCSPSRTAIITGVKTYETGAGNHRSKYPLPEFIEGFPYYLRQAGYYTSNNQKTDYNVANEKMFIRDAWHDSWNKAGWSGRKSGQPFFSVFNFMDSHQSRTMTDSYESYVRKVLDELPESDRIAENEFDMPPFFNDTPEMRKQFARVYNAIKLTDNKIGKLLEQLEKDHLRDSTIIFFFGDHGEGIPRGKTNGINLGYRVPFIVWFPEMYKHLSPWGTGGVVTEELVDFTDLAPTMISLAGVRVPEHLKGRILMGADRSEIADHLVLSSDRSDNGVDMIRTVTDGRYVYSRNFLPFMPELRYIRYMEIGEMKQLMRKDLAEGKLNALQRSLFDPRPAEFLFDVENDPFETRNLANDQDHKVVLERMRLQLRNEIMSSRDVMFLPEYDLAGLSDSTNAYEFRVDEHKYPIEKIYEAASLSGFRGADIARKQVALLNDEDRTVRYWAITGLRSQSSDVLKPYVSEIVRAMQDEYPPVVITASAIAFQEFESSDAMANLKKYAADDNMDLALMAINYLLYTSNKDPFVETIRSVRAMENRSYNVKVACMDFLGSMGLVPNNIEYKE